MILSRVGLCLAVLAITSAFATPALPQATAAESLNFMLRACFETAPTFARTKALVAASGGVRVSNPVLQSLNAHLEAPQFIGLWEAPKPSPKDWLIGLTEGRFGQTRARSCFAAPGRATVPEIEAAISARWPLTALGPQQDGLIYNTRQSFQTKINGAKATIILNWSGERATSRAYVTVLVKVETRNAATQRYPVRRQPARSNNVCCSQHRDDDCVVGIGNAYRPFAAAEPNGTTCECSRRNQIQCAMTAHGPDRRFAAARRDGSNLRVQRT